MNLRIPVVFADGLVVEAVGYGNGSLCLSTQAGCAIRCPFCASGFRGLIRSLTLPELLAQVHAARERGFAPRRFTLSGIGEPLHSFPVLKAFLALAREWNLPVSVTTTGAPLENLAEMLFAAHRGLMISLHAGTAATHARLIPRGPDFEELWMTLRRNWGRLPRRRRRLVGLNYLVLAGVNDQSREIEALARRLKEMPEVTLHLLTCNPVAGSPYSSPPPEQIAGIHRYLRGEGISVRRANPWRQLAEGGCGTLALKFAESGDVGTASILC